MKIRKRSETGLSLVELMIVVCLLTIILGALFTQIEKAQVRYRVEDQRLDLTQQERDFIDQFTRDLHQAGYPSKEMFANTLDYNSIYVSAGVWYVSATDIWIEGDLDDNERVQETRYHYDDGSSWTGSGPNPCPCIRRSSVTKQAFYPWDPNQATPQYYTEVQNLVPPTSGQPIFALYQNNGQPVTLTGSSVVLGSGTTVDPVAANTLQSIKAIRITLTTQTPVLDPDTHKPTQVTMTGTAHVMNN